jgi:hypothetical protein
LRVEFAQRVIVFGKRIEGAPGNFIEVIGTEVGIFGVYGALRVILLRHRGSPSGYGKMDPAANVLPGACRS